MSLPLALFGAALAGLFGWFAAGYQHQLFGDPALRAAPAAGRKLLALRVFLAASTAMAVGLALRPHHYDSGPALLTALFAVVLCVLSSTDFDRRRIPDRLTLPAFVLAIAFSWAWPDRTVGAILVGAAVGLGVGVLLVIVGSFMGNALGIGDGKLMILVGALVGWPAVMSALLYGIAAGGLAAFAIMFRRGRRATYAYGPYLALGALAVLLYADRFA